MRSPQAVNLEHLNLEEIYLNENSFDSWLADSVHSQSAGVQITTLWVLNAGYIAYSGIFRLDRRLSSYPFAVPADSNEPQAEGFLDPNNNRSYSIVKDLLYL